MEGDHAPLLPGTLYLIATPIGNLEDITLRAIRTLKECDVIAAEDTRRTGFLLKHLGISKPLLSYFKFNEARRSEEIIARLERGEKVGLVSDAGSPGISDPGYRVVKAAVAAGLRVEAVPGPSALITALTASGLPTDQFHFVGFLPPKSGQRIRTLEALKELDATLVFYESPYRIEKLLHELKAIFPDREIVLARELTKKFEEYIRGQPAAILAATKKLKGEFVVMVGNKNSEPKNFESRPSAETIPILPAKDLSKTLEFYKSLGFEVTFEQHIPDQYAMVLFGSIELHFFGHSGHIPEKSDHGCYIRTTSVEQVFTAWQAKLPRTGIPRITEPGDKPWGMREFALIDLNGNLIRVGERI